MNPFKGRHFQRDIILWAVRWHCNTASVTELAEMLAERGALSITSTIYSLVQRYAPEMENGCAGTGVTFRSARGTADETYVKVNGRWAYLYWVDSRGRTVDFYLLPSTAKRIPVSG